MSFLRSLLDDLISKRLWPIALLLAVTAVAVPVVLGHGGDAAAPAVAPANVPAVDAAGSTPAVQVVGPPSVRSRPGKVRDPFRRAATAAESVATEDGAPAAKTPAATSGGGAKAPAETGSKSTPAPTVTTPSVPTEQGGATTAPAATVPRTRVHWGADATAAVRGLSRLQPLGGLANPALVYLGTTADHTRAVFVLGPNATATGEGACAEDSCRVVALKAGQKIDVTVTSLDDAGESSFVLAIDEIAEQAVSGEAEAAELRGRVHRDGRDVLREIIKDRKTADAIGQFAYDSARGAVVPTT